MDMYCQQICKIWHKKLNRSENILKTFRGATFFLKYPVYFGEIYWWCRSLESDLRVELERRQQEEEAWYRQQQLLLEAEQARRNIIEDEEQKLSEQRTRWSWQCPRYRLIRGKNVQGINLASFMEIAVQLDTGNVLLHCHLVTVLSFYMSACMLKPYAPLWALRSSNMDLLTVPRTDTSLGLCRFSVAGRQVWNRLPHELRQCNTISSFKSNLKTHYFRRHMDN